jgi:hypothetical protein
MLGTVIAGADRPLGRLWVDLYRLTIFDGLSSPKGDFFKFNPL